MSNGAESETFFCPKCGLRVAEPRAEHLEAIHGVCGTRGCEKKLSQPMGPGAGVTCPDGH